MKKKMKKSKSEKKRVGLVHLVVFGLAGEEYGVRITDLQEIVKFKDVTPIPNSPDFIKGIMDLRGKLAIVMDLRRRFGLNSNDDELVDSKGEDTRRIVIAEVDGNMFGLVVDVIKEVKKVKRKTIKKTPDLISKKIDAKYLKGVSVLKDRLILLLDLSKVLSDVELEKVKKVAKKDSDSVDAENYMVQDFSDVKESAKMEAETK